MNASDSERTHGGLLPQLTIRGEDATLRVPFEPGRSLRHVLDATELRVRSGCRGMGACGLCRVRVLAGEAPEPSQNERLFLDESQLAQGVRLACQMHPRGDLEVELLSRAPSSAWRGLDPTAEQSHPPVGRAVHDLAARGLPQVLPQVLPGLQQPCGVAVDLGTTRIRLSIYDLTSGQWLAGRQGLNPQMELGADVISRLVAAVHSPEQAETLGRLVRDAVADGLWDLASKDGLDLGRVARLCLVGNTAMLALFSGRNHARLLRPESWLEPLDCLPADPAGLAASWGIHPQADVQVLEPLAGFVGSDLLAGVLATDLTGQGPGALLVDFGTNSEMALWDGESLWVTAAAGGPAFEGSGLSCGMPADPGAVYRVLDRSDRTGRGQGLECLVLGGRPAAGICGSGLVDLVAHLLRAGRLSPRGRFTGEVQRFELRCEKAAAAGLAVTMADVDVFQRAKAAIATGIRTLLGAAGMTSADLRRICVAGAFGRVLDVANAQAVGLLPPVDPGVVELYRDTALAGCARALFDPRAAEHMAELAGLVRSRGRVLNLAREPGFDDLFMEHLMLEPMAGATPGTGDDTP